MKCIILTPTSDLSQGGFPFRTNGLQLLASSFSDCTTFDASKLLKESLADKILRLANCYRTRIASIYKKTGKDFDFVFVESLDLFSAAKQFPNAKIVYDAHNVGWEMLEYDLYNSPVLKRLPIGKHALKKWLLWRGKCFEKEKLKEADAILVCSEVDKRKYVKELPETEKKIFVLPNCVKVLEYSPNTKESGNRTVLFFGSFAYSANIDAASIIDEKIASKMPNTKFMIIGNNASKLKLKSPNIEVADFLPMDELKKQIASASIAIVPLRFGSGTRIKILQAFAMEKSVISTSKGVEGIKAISGKHLVIENDFERFPEKISSLLKNKKLRMRLGKNARLLVEKEYDWMIYAKGLERFLLSLNYQK